MEGKKLLVCMRCTAACLQLDKRLTWCYHYCIQRMQSNIIHGSIHLCGGADRNGDDSTSQSSDDSPSSKQQAAASLSHHPMPAARRKDDMQRGRHQPKCRSFVRESIICQPAGLMTLYGLVGCLCAVVGYLQTRSL